MKQRRAPTTGDLLIRIGAGLLALTVLTAVFAWLSYARAHDTAKAVQARTVPAILQITAAREAVIKADRAVVMSFQTREVRLTGPGDEYRNQIAIVGQNLANAAEDNVAGAPGTRVLGLVQGQLLSYMTSIETAADAFREDSDAPLWAADLRNATNLVHAEGGGVIAQLDTLRELQRDELARQVGSGTASTLALLLWLVPAIALLVLLGFTQWLLECRFRRRINPGLVCATVVAGLLIWMTMLMFDTERNIVTAASAVDAAVSESLEQAAVADADGQHRFAELLGETLCRPDIEACGFSVQRWFAALPKSPGYDEGAAEAARPVHTVRADAELAAASERRSYHVFIPVAALVVVAFVVIGLYPRIDEYRFRAR